MPESFGVLLKQARQAAGLTQAAVGDGAGLHQSYVTRLETGEREPPDRATVVRLCDALGVDVAVREQILHAAGHLPDWLLDAAPGDETLAALARFLADEAVSEAAKRDLRALVGLALQRWSSD